MVTDYKKSLNTIHCCTCIKSYYYNIGMFLSDFAHIKRHEDILEIRTYAILWKMCLYLEQERSIAHTSAPK